MFTIIFGLILFCCTYNKCVLCQKKMKQIHIGAVFPMSGDWDGGIAGRPAALMALEDINNQYVILPEYNLTMTMGDSQCVAGLGTKMLYEQIYKPPTKIMFLTGCSTVTTLIAEVAPRWNIVVVSFGSSSPALSNRARFPSFFRTHPSASLQNPTRLRLMKRWNWRRISLIWEMEEVFMSTVHDFEITAKEFNVTILKRQSIQKDAGAVFLAIKSLINVDARIIVGLFYEKLARKVFCEAYHQGLYGPKVIWIIIGWYPDDWWKSNLEKEGINCTADQMKQTVEGHITTESLMWNNDFIPTFSGITAAGFKNRLIEMLKVEWRKESGRLSDEIIAERLSQVTKIPGFPEAPLAYDALWAITIALDKAERRLKTKGLSLMDFQYHDKPNLVYDELHKAMNETNFMGVSTLVYFDSSGSRISWTRIEQMINGSYKLIGHHHIQSDNLTLMKEPLWPSGKIPKDSIFIIRQRQVLMTSVYTSLCCIIIACVVAGSCCVFIYYKEHKSPTVSSKLDLNLTCFFGCILSLFAVLLLGVDRIESVKISSNFVFKIFCQIKVAVFCLGFSIGYGSLFVTIWSVYRKATQNKKYKIDELQTRKESPICDDVTVVDTKSTDVSWDAAFFLSLFCSLDIVILLAWQILDPLERSFSNYPNEKDKVDEDIHYHPYAEVCECKNLSIWLAIIFGWKGLLLIFGLLLAYETRSIKVANSRDIHMMQMAVYNVVIISLISGPVSVVIQTQINAHFAFVSISTLICCSLSLGLIYLQTIVRRTRSISEVVDTYTSDNQSQHIRLVDEQYSQKLLFENEQLRNQITDAENDIEVLRNKLLIEQRVRTTISDDTKKNMNNLTSTSFNNREIHFQNVWFSGKDHDSSRKTISNQFNLQKQMLNKELMDGVSFCLESTSGVYSDT